MIGIVSGVGRLVVGASGSPGSLGALRYARDLACRIDVPVMAVVAWIHPAETSPVVGAGRRGALSRMWRGKVSRYCVSHARCPVLAIPQPVTARELGLGPSVWPLRRRGLTVDQALREWDAA
jgi:nucleotide-binding universal stress UspA family protein